ncbi:MAG TPA: hypothetical protein VFA05_00880 [Gaiellaceae bacterium]|nr:hypothetical protein [Gaiellaceae bacterium]
MRVDWHSKKQVVGLLAAVCAVLLAAGLATGWHNRHKTICPNGQQPVKERSVVLGQTEYRCPDGSTITLS